MNLGKKALAAALLAVALVLINYLASSVPFRLDATAEHIYTLSPGSRSLLAKIDEPIVLDFYYSKGVSDLRVDVKNYADRVAEMLRQYVRASHGKITLNRIDPEPDTPEEEQATAAGIQPQRLQAGTSPYYLGLVAIQADQQKAIPALSPDREQFLEYDLSELLYAVQQVDKKRLGLVSSLPLQGTPGNMMTGQQPTEGQYVATAWQDTFDLVSVDPAATELPEKLDVLAVIHPENLTPRLQYAIDQFLLSGKPVFLAVDPSSQYFKRAGSQMISFGGPPPDVSSDFPPLGQWGVRYDAQKIVGDDAEATQVQLQNGNVIRDPVWLTIHGENFNAKALPTAQLSTLLFIEPGSVSLKPGSPLTFTPLVQTSPKAGEIDADTAAFAQPEDIAGKLSPSGMKTIAAIVTGVFKTAFPDGPPKDEPKKNDSEAARPEAKPPAGPAAAPLKASAKSSTLLVVADTDWLLDDYSIRKFNLLGTTAAEPVNDNLAFAANSLDYLSGSEDLVSIRGKGNSLRPFRVVQDIAAKANEKYQEQLAALENEINDVQSKLTELQGRKTEGNRLVASPEVEKTIDDFQKKAATLRAERRRIRLALRQDIDALENRLLAVNLLATPLLVCAFGVWFYRRRRR